MFCTYCGTLIADDSRFCPACGKHQPNNQSSVAEHPIPQRSLGSAPSQAPTFGQSHRRSSIRKILKWTCIGMGAMIGLLVILIVVSAMFLDGTEDKDTPSDRQIIPTATPNFEEAKTQASQISYDDLFRNNEQHIGKTVYFRGQVIQVIDGSENRYQLRVNVTQQEFLWDDTVFLRYTGPRLLEDDLIEFVGTVNGLVNYEAIFGNKVTIPDITALVAQRINGNH